MSDPSQNTYAYTGLGTRSWDKGLRRSSTGSLSVSSQIRAEKFEIATRAIQRTASKQNDVRGPVTDGQIIAHLLLDKLNILLLAIPFGMAAVRLDWGDPWVFGLCFVGLCPLAKLLGDATEHLAESLNETIGGLLNATFGNAVEMIITIQAIKGGMLEVVKKSLLGSILSNLLLVLGMAFFAGGLTRAEQSFPDGAALINVTMLLVGILSFSLPTVFAMNAQEYETLRMSRISACFVAVGYIAYLVFQLWTHAEFFEDVKQDAEDPGELQQMVVEGKGRSRELPGLGAGKVQVMSDAEDEDARLDKAVLSVAWATGLLFVSTVIVAFLSEYMVDSIDGLVKEVGVPRAFVGTILLPIVGNACEHASAVRMAYNNKPATAVAIAVGSSTQIALFVMPFSVLIAWWMGQPLDLNVHPTGLCVTFMSVLVVFSIVMDGKSNWLEGFMLVLAYCLTGVLYWFTTDAMEAGPSGVAVQAAFV